MTHSGDHFDEIAGDYDYWKNRNRYYYDQLKQALLEIISEPSSKRILDIGCGTGDLLAFLKPKVGAGMDVSKEMIEIAQKKHPSFTFFISPIESFKHGPRFDYIVFVDVIEHVADLKQSFSALAGLMDKETRLIIMMANPWWEPILMLLEKMGKKMPEGPHYRPSSRNVRKLIADAGLRVERHLFRQLIPMQMGAISRMINNNFHKVPLLDRAGLTEIFIVRTASDR